MNAYGYLRAVAKRLPVGGKLGNGPIFLTRKEPATHHAYGHIKKAARLAGFLLAAVTPRLSIHGKARAVPPRPRKKARLEVCVIVVPLYRV